MTDMEQKARLPWWLFFLPALLFTLAGLIPLFKGEPPNFVFVALGATWVVLGIAFVKRARKPPVSND
ncbi:MAG: hypothetical protein ACRD2J_04910 [Thermoanaerobaculia bacterium]